MPSPMKKSRKKMKKGDRKPKVEWKWGKEQEEAFQKLKACLTSPPILAFADYDLPFELHTDASGTGLGAVLYGLPDERRPEETCRFC